MSIRIIGVGKALPQKLVKNDELDKSLDTSDEWIRSHTGIVSRYIAGEDESSASLGTLAAEQALKHAKNDGYDICRKDIGLIITATVTPEYRSFPTNACLIQRDLQAVNAAAFDISAACTGFIYALKSAASLMESMDYKYAVVVGAEVITKILNWEDRSTCVLFGDGAGSVILQKTDNNDFGIRSTILGSDGNGFESLYLDKQNHLIHMDGKSVYFFAVAKMGEILEALLEKEKISIDDVDLVVCHQANERIIKAATKRLGFSQEKIIINIEEYGNTSSATIPITLADLYEQGRLKAGMTVLLVGFGAGLTWGGCVVKW
ncbi:MAG: beta-ketoacyl-ACP synthase III [Treponemataceae bacterium]